MKPDLQKTVEDIQSMVSRALQSLQEIEAVKGAIHFEHRRIS